MIVRIFAVLLILAGTGSIWTSQLDANPPATEGSAEEVIDFDRQIRPILARYCLPCHGNDGEARKKKLRLDDRASATDGSGRSLAAIAPGHPELSLILQRIDDDDDPMPPDGRQRPSTSEVALLKEWIEQGAVYTRHWSWRPLEVPGIPQVESAEWATDDVDRFVLADLESLDLTAARDASPEEWVRRVTFDLTGLPPTPDQLKTFLLNDSREFREQFVDQLLASTAHAEHFARHWLDLVRYAETHGHEFDYPIEYAWKYRDYVIRAMAEDVPIDRLVQEHIAGDLLEEPRLHPQHGTDESPVATGWFWLIQATHAPVDVLKDTHDRVDNQIDVVSRAFLGATVSCARCHDHKFDGIRQADWTGISGIIRSTRRVHQLRDLDGKIFAALQELDVAREKFQEEFRKGIELQQQMPLVSLARTARDVRRGEYPLDTQLVDSDILLMDFEDGWKQWRVEGDAFGEKPHHIDEAVLEQGEAAVGMHFASSLDRRVPSEISADDRKGKLTSPAFTLDRDYLLFLISGGNHAGETCVRLLVDGEEIYSASGVNSTKFEEVRWDVRQWSGQQAVIEVKDDKTGSWGHINCDHFRLSDLSSEEGLPSRAQIAQIATKEGLDAGLLRNWIHQWPSLESAAPAAGALREGDLLLGDFSSEQEWSQWSRVGDAFSQGKSGEAVLIGRPRVIDADCAHSARYGRGQVGSLLSRNFRVEHRFLHLRVQGELSKMKLVIEGFWLDEHNALLFEGLRQGIEHADGWKHIQIDLARFQGRNAHVEINDDGRGWAAVDRVWLSADGAQSSAGADWSLIDDPSSDSRSLLADPVRLEALLATDLVEPARFGSAWNAAVVHSIQELKRIDDAMPQPDRVLACDDAPVGFDTPLAIRGDHRQPGQMITRRTIEGLDRIEDRDLYQQGSGRLAMANWITHRDNPLFWRTQANRLWARVMGEGLATTTDDLGAMGIPPENQRLLDHLSCRLRDHRSRRQLLRSLVLSRTYGMSSSVADPRAEVVDPQNRRWHRAHQKRLGAEAIRDSVLAVSGRLDLRSEGPSVPVHLNDFLTGRGRPGSSGPEDGDGRRSVYISVRRNFLPSFLTVFDFPTPATTVGTRDRTNVPAQSLTLMNDPFVHGQVRLWGEKLHRRSEEHGTEATVEWMWWQAFGRPPAAEEIKMAKEFIGEKGVAGWQDLAHTLVQAKEFRFIR